jgi:hypothetical protein
MTEIQQAVARGRLGLWSVWLALIAFSCSMTAAMIAVQSSKTPGPLYDVVFPVFAVIFGLAAPIAHFVGFGLGMTAIFRAGDRRGLGILGACLNAGAIGIVVLLVWAALQGLASFR